MQIYLIKVVVKTLKAFTYEHSLGKSFQRKPFVVNRKKYI